MSCNSSDWLTSDMPNTSLLSGIIIVTWIVLSLKTSDDKEILFYNWILNILKIYKVRLWLRFVFASLHIRPTLRHLYDHCCHQ